MFGNLMFDRFWKRRAPKNDEDPLNKMLEILYMGSISIKHMEWTFGNMGQISFKNITGLLNL